MTETAEAYKQRILGYISDQEPMALLAAMPSQQWQQYGVHTERGVESVADTAALYAGHDLSHLRQIAAILDRESHTIQ